MTGPEHYTEAERLLELARTQTDWSSGEYLIGAAQVHATLALVATVGRPPILHPPVIVGHP